MQIFEGIDGIRTYISKEKKLNKSIGLVPTMGALHAGHLSLVSKSVQQNQITIVTIFINPLQFNNNSDLDLYPKTLERDLDLLKESNCDAVFIPNENEMYKHKPTISFGFGKLDTILEGKHRLGHFNGVGIVVSKLFNIIQPNHAYFGQKDYQQFLIIKSIIIDLSFSIELHCEEIIREESGLAMSSRNLRLNDIERKHAALIAKSLSQIKNEIRSFDFQTIKMNAIKVLEQNNLQIEYLELANRETLEVMDRYNPSTPSVVLIAAYVGQVRLIDNMFV